MSRLPLNGLRSQARRPRYIQKSKSNLLSVISVFPKLELNVYNLKTTVAAVYDRREVNQEGQASRLASLCIHSATELFRSTFEK
jgi:hypothetical protein